MIIFFSKCFKYGLNFDYIIQKRTTHIDLAVYKYAIGKLIAVLTHSLGDRKFVNFPKVENMKNEYFVSAFDVLFVYNCLAVSLNS